MISPNPNDNPILIINLIIAVIVFIIFLPVLTKKSNSQNLSHLMESNQIFDPIFGISIKNYSFPIYALNLTCGIHVTVTYMHISVYMNSGLYAHQCIYEQWITLLFMETLYSFYTLISFSFIFLYFNNKRDSTIFNFFFNLI